MALSGGVWIRNETEGSGWIDSPVRGDADGILFKMLAGLFFGG